MQKYLLITVFDIASIVLICDYDIYKNFDYYISVIRHELIHILHKSIKSSINEYAGEADFYTDEIAKFYNEYFPTFNNLKYIKFTNPTEMKCALILVACLYYLDTSEYFAWLDSYEVQLNNFIQSELFDYNTILSKGLTYPSEWLLMHKIYTMLKYYKIEIITAANNTKCKNLMQLYFLDINIKPIETKI